MRTVRAWVVRVAGLFGKERRDRELADEIETNLQLHIEENVRAGMAPEEARRQALLKFGGVESAKEGYRERRGIPMLETLWQDVRFGARMLRKSSGFTIVAVLTLALGIGATTAIFSVVNAVLLRPLPYAHSDRIVSVQEAGRGIGNPASYPDFFDWQSQNHVFRGMAAYHGAEVTLTGAGEPLHLQALVASGGLFGILEAKPLLGRTFVPQDDERGQNVVVLSHSLWLKEFHASRSIVGQSIVLDNARFTVIGTMPPGFEFPPSSRKDLWISAAVDRESASNIMTGRGYNVLSAIARLKPRVTLADAQADMDVIARLLAKQYPQSNIGRTTVRIVPELDRVVGDIREPLLLILAVVAGILFICCINVASLSLARNLVREKEIAVRAALGAHRSRVFKQLLTESLLLALLGGTAGIGLAAWGTQQLLRLAPEDLPRVAHIGVDWSVLAFALVLSLATGIVFGCVPALRASKTSLADSLKEAGPVSSQGVSQLRLQNSLVVLETCLAVVLLIGTGLLTSSYVRLVRVPLGFNPGNLLTFNFDLPTPPYTLSRTVAFTNELLARLRALPSVKSAATDWSLPLSGNAPSTGVEFEGRQFAPGSTPEIIIDTATPSYFGTMGIPLLKGRVFTDADDASSTPVVVVNQAFVQRYFPNESPLGKRIRPSFSVTSTTPWREIVGVVGNTKLGGLAEEFQPEFYTPFAQVPNFSAVVLRTATQPLSVVPEVRAVLASLDKNIPIYDVETMDGYVSALVAARRFSVFLLGLFAALALLLAAVGIYGVTSFSAGQRTHEIGIRRALGAQRDDVLRLVVWHGARLAFLGVITGLAAAAGLTRLIRSLLFGVSALDPFTFAVVAVLLTVVALLACWIPARRAMRVDPMVALRHE